MNALELQQKILEREEDLLAFVQRHYDDLKGDWEQWLKKNSLSQQIVDSVVASDKIRLSDVCRYRAELDDLKGLRFHEISREDPEWNASAAGIHIETDGSAGNVAERRLHKKRIDFKPAGIIHRLEICSDHDSVILHLDYLLAITERAYGDSEEYSSPLPTNLPQQTFIEARSVALALADGPRLIGWESITGEIGLRHVIPGSPMQTRILLDEAQNPWNLPTTCESLREELQELELSSLLLLNVAIGCVLQKPQMRASIDDLIGSIGWKPRTRAERLEMRRKIWRWLLLFDSMSVHGKRPGKYRDRLTGAELNLTSSDALIKVTGKRFQKDAHEDPQAKEIPLEVHWVAGPWLDQWRGNSQVLHYFGDLQKIASIATGKASGAWAQSIGLALHQLWRERARTAEVSTVGEKNQLTAKLKTFTRFELLSFFRSEPWVEDLLNSDKPHRAKKYWAEAVRKLKVGGAGIIGHYREIDPIPENRKGWEEAWLKYQRLDIRPRGEDIEAIAKISKSGARARR